MRPQAEPVNVWPEVYAHQRARRQLVSERQQRRAAAREGLIYTRTGVLDMTRQHKPLPAAPEEIIIWIGGARTW